MPRDKYLTLAPAGTIAGRSGSRTNGHPASRGPRRDDERDDLRDDGAGELTFHRSPPPPSIIDDDVASTDGDFGVRWRDDPRDSSVRPARAARYHKICATDLSRRIRQDSCSCR